jgi:polyisoprenoid-binding protein YceI
LVKNIYEIDPAHSSIQFSIRHMMISNVRGGFSGVKGTVTYDPDNLAESGVRAEIDVNTISTQDATRDSHLKTAEFFDADHYPTITFVSKKIEKLGDGEFSITGDLTIHGVTKETVLKVDEVSPEGKDPWGNVRTGASAKAKVNRKDFGLTWNAPLETGGILIGDEVKLELDVEMIKMKAATA